jgi:hypothetical protein
MCTCEIILLVEEFKEFVEPTFHLKVWRIFDQSTVQDITTTKVQPAVEVHDVFLPPIFPRLES